MKKIYFAISAAMLVLAGCSNDEFETNQTSGLKSFTSFNVTVDDGALTRAHLSDGYHFAWDKNDYIKVYSDETTTPVSYKKESDLPGTLFIGDEVTGNVFYAYGQSNISSSNWTFNKSKPTVLGYKLSGEIIFPDNGYDLNYIPMVGKSTNNEILMKHTVGLLRFSMDGNFLVKRITLMGNNGEILAGNGTIDMTADEPILVMNQDDSDNKFQLVLNYMYSTSYNYLHNDRYKFDEDYNGKKYAVTEDGANDFYFPIPVQSFSKGITLKIEGYDAADEHNDHWKVMYKTSDKPFEMTRGKIVDFDELDIDAEIAAGERIISPAEEDLFVDNGYSSIWEVHTTDENMVDKMQSVADALKNMDEKDLRQIRLIMPEAYTVPESMFSTVNGIYNLYAFEGENVQTVGKNAFNYYNGYSQKYKLTSAYLPQVKRIGEYAFNSSYLKQIDFPLLTQLGESAFYDNDSLVSVNLPILTSLTDYAFFDCNALRNIELPAVTSIAYEAFALCDNLESVSLPELTVCNDNSIFLRNINLVNVYAPKLTNLTWRMFEDCTSLESIDLPSVTTMEDDVFAECSSLKEVSLPLLTNVTYEAFRNCTSLKTISLPQVTSIDRYAFYGCTKLATVDFPLADYIGSEVFRGTNIRNLVLPNAETIEERAFKDTKLANVTLPMVKTLGSNLFEGNNTMLSLTIGGGDGWSGSVHVDKDAFVVNEGYLGVCALHLNGLSMFNPAAAPVFPTTNYVSETIWDIVTSARSDSTGTQWTISASIPVNVSGFGSIFVNDTQIK